MKRLLVIALLLVQDITAQSLDDYCRAVAAYSRTLKSASTVVDAAMSAERESRTGYLPQFSAAGRFSIDARRRDDEKRWRFSLEPEIVQRIYRGGAVRAAVESASLEVDAALCDEEYIRLEVRYAADYAYWNLSAAALYEASMREYVNIIRSLKRVVDERFDEGLIARGDVLMIDTRLSEAEFELIAAEQRSEVALHNFNILRGEHPDTTVGLSESIRDSMPMPRRVMPDDVLGRRPDYAAMQLRADKAAVGVRAARAPYNPQIDVGVSGSWQPESPNRSGRTRIEGLGFVSLSVPIFHWGERRYAVRRARAVQRHAEWEAAALHDDIAREESNAWTVLVRSRAQVATSDESLRIAGENLALGTYSYGEGLATVLDVLQAQLSWIQIYTNAIDARFDYALAIAEYARTTGQ